ncbi:MAG: hypothetical protein AVDCRST_MAG88-36, partial [uncultured Thermomicrobiales bacterium]
AQAGSQYRLRLREPGTLHARPAPLCRRAGGVRAGRHGGGRGVGRLRHGRML